MQSKRRRENANVSHSFHKITVHIIRRLLQSPLVAFSLRLGHRTALTLLTSFTTVLPLRYLSEGAVLIVRIRAPPFSRRKVLYAPHCYDIRATLPRHFPLALRFFLLYSRGVTPTSRLKSLAKFCESRPTAEAISAIEYPPSSISEDAFLILR